VTFHFLFPTKKSLMYTKLMYILQIIVAEQDVSLPTVLLIQQLKCVDLDPIVNVNSYGTNPIGQRNDKIFLNTIRKH